MCYCSLKERHASARVNTVQPKTLNPEPEHPVGNARVCTMVSQSIDLWTLLLLLLVVARLPVHFVLDNPQERHTLYYYLIVKSRSQGTAVLRLPMPVSLLRGASCTVSGL